MTTKAAIFAEMDDGTILCTTVNRAGTLTYTGRVLAEHYTAISKITKLCQMGYIELVGYEPELTTKEEELTRTKYTHLVAPSDVFNCQKLPNKFANMDVVEKYFNTHDIRIHMCYLFTRTGWFFAEYTPNKWRRMTPELINYDFVEAG